LPGGIFGEFVEGEAAATAFDEADRTADRLALYADQAKLSTRSDP
jgi:hypothetical protein